MQISVILCTYNRCKSLARTLDSLAMSVLPEAITWEVLVVDNNSSDGTKAVVEDFCGRYAGRFRYLFEPRQGKSYALNTGIHGALGEILAFTDDDIVVDRLWLKNLTAVLDTGEWAGAAGRVLPEPGFVPPRWLALDGPFNLMGALCAPFDVGDKPCELEKPPQGDNMAFRKEMFAKYGLFRTDLGPFPDKKIGFEDTEFGRRLMAGGEHLYYIPSATVFHEINESRVRKEHFLAWWYAFGRGSVREIGGASSGWATLKIAGRTVLTALEWLLTFDAQGRFYRKCRVWYGVGKLVEVFQKEKRAKPQHKPNPQPGEEPTV